MLLLGVLGLIFAFEFTYARPPYTVFSDTSGPTVIAFQTRLRQAGYYNGDITGVFDLRTSVAIARFQSTHGLLGTGGIDQPTAQALGIHLSAPMTGPAMP